MDLDLTRMELQTARDLGEHLLTLAQRVGDPALRLEAHYALGNTSDIWASLPLPRPIFRRE